MGWIVGGEIVKIHAYLMKPPRLRYMAGGSSLIEIFSTRIVSEIGLKVESPDGKVRTSAAGRFFMEFDEKKNADIFFKIIGYTGNHLFGPGSLLVCEPVEKDDHVVSTILDRIKVMKVSVDKKSLSTNPLFQFMERCDACGDWEAQNTGRDGEQVCLCDICYSKLKVRNSERIEIPFHNTIKKLCGFNGIIICKEGVNPDGSDDYLRVSYPGNDVSLVDFKTLADKSSPGGYMGVFYADGNSMGELLSRCDTLESYRDLSGNISKTSKDALKTAKDKVESLYQERFNCQVFIGGGDDLLAVLPADQALKFAEEFLLASSDNGTALENGICGGLIIAKPGIPFNILYEKADELLTSAKRQVWKRRNEEKKTNSQRPVNPQADSAIDFMLMTSSMLESLDKRSERKTYTLPDRINHISFTARPYLISEFQCLLKKIKGFKDINPPNKMFMSLKDIFHPYQFDKDKDQRLDDNAEFVELKKLIKRQMDIYPQFRKEIESFFNGGLLENNLYWKGCKDSGDEVDVKRVWEADIVEIVDFI